jgi:branched-chain amino acid transport system substrate-binding protein
MWRKYVGLGPQNLFVFKDYQTKKCFGRTKKSFILVLGITTLLAMLFIQPGSSADQNVVPAPGAQVVVPQPYVVVAPVVQQLPSVQGGAQPAQATVQITPGLVPTKMVANKVEIPICVSASRKGEHSIIGSHLFDGLNLFFNKMSQDNGQAKFVVRVYDADNESDQIKAKDTIIKLSANSPIFMNLVGGANFSAVLPTIQSKKLAMLFPIGCSDGYRINPPRETIYFRPPYEAEMEALVAYVVKRLKKKKIAILHEDGDWGESLCSKLKGVMQKYQIKPVEVAVYPNGTVNVAQAVDAISKKFPSVVFCLATARAASAFVRLAINKGLYRSVFVGTSELVAIQSVLRNLRGVDIITSAIVPDPLKSQLPIAKEFRDNMQKYLSNYQISTFYFEGYLSGALLCEALKIAAQPITIDSLMTVFENLKAVDLGGFKVAFDHATRTFSRQVWINLGNDSEFIPAEEILNNE